MARNIAILSAAAFSSVPHERFTKLGLFGSRPENGSFRGHTGILGLPGQMVSRNFTSESHSHVELAEIRLQLARLEIGP